MYLRWVPGDPPSLVKKKFYNLETITFFRHITSNFFQGLFVPGSHVQYISIFRHSVCWFQQYWGVDTCEVAIRRPNLVWWSIAVDYPELSTGRMDPRVGSGRIGSGHDFAGIWRVGSGRVSTSDFVFVHWLFLGA